MIIATNGPESLLDFIQQYFISVEFRIKVKIINRVLYEELEFLNIPKNKGKFTDLLNLNLWFLTMDYEYIGTLVEDYLLLVES